MKLVVLILMAGLGGAIIGFVCDKLKLPFGITLCCSCLWGLLSFLITHLCLKD